VEDTRSMIVQLNHVDFRDGIGEMSEGSGSLDRSLRCGGLYGFVCVERSLMHGKTGMGKCKVRSFCCVVCREI
jgi:hypothetical protein